MTVQPSLPGHRPALVLAHPGHELRIYHWLEQAAPLVFVLTDGSGAGAEGRIESTARLLSGIAGVRPGDVFGRFTDRQIYEAILAQDFSLFLQLADDLARAFVREGVDYVVSDAEEEYNPAHDVCRVVVECAVGMTSTTYGRPLPAYDFLLAGAPDACPDELQADAIWLRLDGSALQRKLNAARGYPEMANEVENAIARYGVAPFGVECLRPAAAHTTEAAHDYVPYYEQYGEKRVAEGVYERVLRFREHMLPLTQALRGHVAALH